MRRRFHAVDALVIRPDREPAVEARISHRSAHASGLVSDIRIDAVPLPKLIGFGHAIGFGVALVHVIGGHGKPRPDQPESTRKGRWADVRCANHARGSGEWPIDRFGVVNAPIVARDQLGFIGHSCSTIRKNPNRAPPSPATSEDHATSAGVAGMSVSPRATSRYLRSSWREPIEFGEQLFRRRGAGGGLAGPLSPDPERNLIPALPKFSDQFASQVIVRERKIVRRLFGFKRFNPLEQRPGS